ncbi:hypothetical protein ZWY2020_057415 [Hordeum vulgare]|nr:hypothetical protein ZWY2020_057415 [Hordeum vulgare]
MAKPPKPRGFASSALDAVQWPLARDVAAVKLDPLHYSFSFAFPASPNDPAPDLLHYGLTLSVPTAPTLAGAYTVFSASPVAAAEGWCATVARSRPPQIDRRA